MKLPNLKKLAPALRSLLFLSLLLSLPVLAFSQATTRVAGTVTDSSGAVLPGASITAQNEQTGQTTTAVSGADGTFSIDLPAGFYTVTVSASRYASYVLRKFAATVGAARSLSFTLERAHPKKARRPQGEGNAPSERPSENNNPPPPPPKTAARPPTAGDHSTSGRSFLVGNDVEESGYGLYSYLLFSSAPANDDEKQRDLAVIQAFVGLLSDVSDLQSSGLTKSDINVTYLLVVETPHEKIPAPDWVLSHYDFARAKVLLHLFHHDVLGGPYVASCLTPLSQGGAAPEHHLWQDMTHVPAAVAASWEKEFERRATRQDFWAPDTRNQSLLGLRDFISTAASGLASVNTASADFKTMLADWVSWK
jgi:hypothetical protein